MISTVKRRLRDHPSSMGWAVPSLTVVLGMQSVRLLLSLASFLLRDTFGWDAPYIGALGFAIFATGFLWAVLRRLLGPRLILIATAGGLGVLRLATQAWSGDPLADFVLATGAVILFILFLPSFLGYGTGRQEAARDLALGFLVGLSIDLALHGAYTTYDLGWDDGVYTLMVIGVLVALQLALLWRLLLQAVDPETEGESEDARHGSWSVVLPWLGLGPFLFLQLLVFQNLARLVALSEWSFPLAFAWALFGHAAGIIAGLWALNSAGRSRWALVALAGVLLIAAMAVPADGATSAAGVLLVGQVASAVLLVMIVVGQAGTDVASGQARMAAVHGSSMVILLVFLFGNYAIYDMDLPYENAWLPPLAGLVLGISGLASLRSLPGPKPSIQVAWLPAAFALLLVIVPLAWALRWESPSPTAGAGYPVRVMTYNLHNGFDTDSHLGMEAIARVIEAQMPDVVGLQEVSRGWVVNGSLDMLTWLSQRLALPYIFGPSTGPLWGNAILSRYPVLEWGSVGLPPDGLIFQRAYMWARLDLGDGDELLVVNTHLQNIREDAEIRDRQVQALLEFWENASRTAIMGDFNIRRDDPEADLMRRAGLADVLALAGTTPGYTVPADAPRYQIDYIWLSPDLTVTHVVIPASTASDHLPVVASIE